MVGHVGRRRSGRLALRDGADETEEGTISPRQPLRPPRRALHELGDHETARDRAGRAWLHLARLVRRRPAVPTWNFVIAHLTARPRYSATSRTYAVLERLVDHFEERMPEPRRMNGTEANAAYAARIVSGTVGFRMRVDRYTGKNKMSQNRPAETVERIIHELEHGEHYASPELAREMRRSRGESV